jgi:triosephosphate isomerase
VYGLKTLLIVVNFKTYLEGTGEEAVTIAGACAEVTEESGVTIAVAPQHCDIYRVASRIDVPVYAQHVDGMAAGGHTGHVLARCVRDAGAVGTLINHSEHRLRLADIEASVAAARAEGLTSIVCTNNVPTTAAAAALAPDYVAVEPPELIGSGIPVSKADPQVVEDSVRAVQAVNPEVRVLCGAGISKGEDVIAAMELGAEGVLLASGVVKAEDPKTALEGLVSRV